MATDIEAGNGRRINFYGSMSFLQSKHCYEIAM
jgi:hypothetical protein